MEWRREEFVISDDRARVDVPAVAAMLAQTYWGHRRPRPVVEKLVENSLCFSLHREGEQIGFARVVTDFQVFSWLSDLVLREDYRGRGLGKWLLRNILDHPRLSQTQFVLQTTEAFGLYEKAGFLRSEKLMTRRPGPS